MVVLLMIFAMLIMRVDDGNRCHGEGCDTEDAVTKAIILGVMVVSVDDGNNNYGHKRRWL